MPKFVPERFRDCLVKSTTYENLVPLVPEAGTKVKPIGTGLGGVLLTFVPIIDILIVK